MKIILEISDFDNLTNFLDSFFCCENNGIEIVITKENSSFYITIQEET